MFSPDSSLRLLNMRMDSELRNTLWFPDRNTQTNWFLSQSDFISFTDYSYVKKDNTIVLACREEDIWRFNYVMYQNTNFSNKWFYAFIVKREWASDYSTRIYLKTDPLQTWMFDWSLMTSFIERQHSTTDTPGDNIIPEPIGGSQTIYQQAGTLDASPSKIYVYATCFPDGVAVNGSFVNEVYSGSSAVQIAATDSAGVTQISEFLKQYVTNGLASAVSRIQAMPFMVGASSATRTYSQHPTTLDGYTPRNKKLLSGAFVKGYLAAYGQEVEFTPEFCNGDVTIRAAEDVTTGAVYYYVENYGAHDTDSNTSAVGFVVTMPESTWAYNQYKNDYNLHSGSNAIFRERSGIQRGVNTASSVLGTIGNVAGLVGNIQQAINPVDDLLGTGSIGSAIQGAVGNISSGIQNAASSYYGLTGIDEISQNLAYIDESYNAPAVGSVAASNPFLAAGITDMKWGWKVPDSRFAERYDQFLDIYGYSQNTYAIPNLHARTAWTYVKVTELMLDGNCPDEDEIQIRQAFRNGVFWWVYNKEFGNFNQDNSIV